MRLVDLGKLPIELASARRPLGVGERASYLANFATGARISGAGVQESCRELPDFWPSPVQLGTSCPTPGDLD